MKRMISLVLSVVLLIGILPVNARAEELTSLTVKHDGQYEQYSVIDCENDFLFSGEDLAKLGGYDYRIEKGYAYFTRGVKVLRIHLTKNRLEPYYELWKKDYCSYGKVDFENEIQQINGVYYFPGADLLPWLSVNCFEDDGILTINTDPTTVWEIVEDFDFDDFAFELEECCEELGVKSKHLKIMSYILKTGLTNVALDFIPPIGKEMDYINLFDDFMLDHSNVEDYSKELLDGMEDASYWLELFSDKRLHEQGSTYPKEFETGSKLYKNVSNGLNLVLFCVVFQQQNQMILDTVETLAANGSRYGLPDEARMALTDTYYNYRDIYLGLEAKLGYILLEEGIDAAATMASGWLGAILKLLGFTEVVAPDWMEGVNRVTPYQVIAAYCRKGYKDAKQGGSPWDVKQVCHFAYTYLYSCEQNWNTMATYALDEKENLDLYIKYKQKAILAGEWQAKFLEAYQYQVNDSDAYGDTRMKKEYIEKLHEIFVKMNREAVPANPEPIEMEISKEEQYELNIFMSNFSEAYFPCSDFADDSVNTQLPFISDTADPMVMVIFAWMHTKINGGNLVYIDYQDYAYYGLSIDTISDVSMRFFGRPVTPADIRAIPDLIWGGYDWVLVDGYVCGPAAVGETYNWMTIVDRMYDCADGTRRIEFTEYSIDCDDDSIIEISAGIVNKSVYSYTPEQAQTHPSFRARTHGSALIQPYVNENGRNTYRLISYDIFTPNESIGTDGSQRWTITKRNTGIFDMVRDETYDVYWQSGNIYSVFASWPDDEDSLFMLVDANVDFQKRTIDILMDYAEGDSGHSELVIDLYNNQYYFDSYFSFED